MRKGKRKKRTVMGKAYLREGAFCHPNLSLSLLVNFAPLFFSLQSFYFDLNIWRSSCVCTWQELVFSIKNRSSPYIFQLVAIYIYINLNILEKCMFRITFLFYFTVAKTQMHPVDLPNQKEISLLLKPNPFYLFWKVTSSSCS